MFSIFNKSTCAKPNDLVFRCTSNNNKHLLLTKHDQLPSGNLQSSWTLRDNLAAHKNVHMQYKPHDVTTSTTTLSYDPNITTERTEVGMQALYPDPLGNRLLTSSSTAGITLENMHRSVFCSCNNQWPQT